MPYFYEKINNQSTSKRDDKMFGSSSYPRVASKFSDVNVTTCASIAAAEKIKVKRALILLELLQKKRPWLSLGWVESQQRSQQRSQFCCVAINAAVAGCCRCRLFFIRAAFSSRIAPQMCTKIRILFSYLILKQFEYLLRVATLASSGNVPIFALNKFEHLIPIAYIAQCEHYSRRYQNSCTLWTSR